MCSADRRDYKEAQVGPTDRGGEEASSKKVAHQKNTSIGIIKIAYIYLHKDQRLNLYSQTIWSTSTFISIFWQYKTSLPYFFMQNLMISIAGKITDMKKNRGRFGENGVVELSPQSFVVRGRRFYQCSCSQGGQRFIWLFQTGLDNTGPGQTSPDQMAR